MVFVDCNHPRPPWTRGIKAFGLFCLLLPSVPVAATWHTYRADAARTGYTPEGFSGPLAIRWRFESGRPAPAWPRSGRMSFDQAPQPVLSEQFVFFGHSADHSLYRLDRESGEGKLIFTADGPIRFAPTIWNDQLFVVSDDGFLYSLDFDGQVRWKHRGGPQQRLRLGNEQIISKWPARGAPVIVDDVVYYAAGIWPSDEIFVHALSAGTGQVVWTNDDSGGIYMPQPHGGADAESGVSAQGYLVASAAEATNVSFPTDAPLASRLLLPTGRAVPAAFDLESGSFEYFHLQQYGKRGGFATMAVGPMFFNSGIAFDAQSGQETEKLGDGPMVAFPGGIIRGSRTLVAAYQWVEQQKTDRRGNQSSAWGLKPLWEKKGVDAGSSMIAAGQSIVCGGEGQLTILDLQTGNLQAEFSVPGTVYGLAAAADWLVVSTDMGAILGLSLTEKRSSDDAAPRPQDQPDSLNVDRADPLSEPLIHVRDQPVDLWPRRPEIQQAATEILDATQIRDGYVLDYGCGDGQLAYALAGQTNLRIYAVDDNIDNVLLARQRLQAAGLYGTRVTVHHVADLQQLPHPRYFANLIVSGRSALGSFLPWLPQQEGGQPLPSDADSAYFAALRPYGGIARFGPAGRMSQTTRGELAGAGQWTHQYASANNKLCSTDDLVQGSLGMLWYRDIDIDVPQRHGRAPAPLFFDGLLYHEGIDELVCVDAYNGRVVWRYDLPGVLKAFDGDELMGVSGTNSNFCVGQHGLYVRHQDQCYRLDRKTGELLGLFPAPLQTDGEAGTWGYIAVDGDRLYGSLADRQHQVTFRWRASTGDMSQQLTESRSFFVLDAQTGDLRWRYDATESIRHNAIAADDQHVYLIDRAQATFDRRRDAKAADHPHGALLALDAQTGREVWRADHDIDGTMLAVSPEHQRLLMSYQPTRYALASEVGGKMTVFSTADGQQTWRQKASYSSRPMINDYTIYAQGGAWDLLTGQTRPFDFSRSYGCGVLAGSRHLMVYRSATLGYYNLNESQQQTGTQNYGGMRPGCWINAIPAGGLVLVPDASAGCVCSYLNQSWIALEPLGIEPPQIAPEGGAYREPVQVTLTPDDAGTLIRYTLDGSAPTEDSPVYRGPVTIQEDARLRTRSFAADGGISRVADQRYVIDPHALNLDPSAWRIWDVDSNVHSAPSRWSVRGGVIRQQSNIFQGVANEKDPLVERYGTLKIYVPEQPFVDGTIEAEIMSADDDGIGLAFRLQDQHHHYLWNSDLERKFSVLTKKDGDDFSVLAKSDWTYEKKQWFRLQVILKGSRIQILVDDQPLFDVADERFDQGSLALHCWGSDDVQFRGLRFIPSEQEQGQ